MALSMRRIFSVIAVAALMAAMLAASAMPAFAESVKGNCIGAITSAYNQLGKNTEAPGFGGNYIIATGAKIGYINDEASSNCGRN